MKMESLITIGIILLLIGFIFIIIGSISSMIKGKTDVKSAGIVFIGPIPLFGWASDKKMLYILIGFTLLLIILWFLLRKYL